MGGTSQPSHGLHALWSVEIDLGGASVCSARLSAFPSALPTRGGRALGVATRRVWLGGDCADWEVSLPGTSECSGDASGASGTWHSYCAAQCEIGRASCRERV